MGRLRFLKWRLRDFTIAATGVAAIEFGVVGPVFLALVFGTFETGGLLVRSMTLDRALDKAVRVVRVKGGVTTISQAQFRDMVCDGLLMFSSGCKTNLTVEMTVVKSTAGFPSASAPCVSRVAPNPTVNYSSGSRSDMIYVRSCLLVDPMLPLIASGLGFPRNASGGFHVISTSGFMNEP